MAERQFSADDPALNLNRQRTSGMDTDTLIALLRSATEDDVQNALENGQMHLPLTIAADLLEFYNQVVDVLLKAGAVEREAERVRIPPGFGSTD